MVWQLKDKHIIGAASLEWGSFPTDFGLPDDVAEEVVAGHGSRYLYRVCTAAQRLGSEIKPDGGDQGNNFGTMWGAGAYPNLVTCDGSSITPIIVDAIANGYANGGSPFIHAGVDARKIWNKYGEPWRHKGHWLCRINMSEIAAANGTLLDGYDFIDMSTAMKCSRWIDPNCSFYVKNEGKVVHSAGDSLRKAFNYATFDTEILLAINVPTSAMEKITTAPYVDRKLQEASRVKYLACPFAEKDAVKRLGAKWDPEDKKWFVRYKTRDELIPFRRWIVDVRR